MSAAASSGRFRPVDYPDDFVSRVRTHCANHPIILDLIAKRAYSVGAYLSDICALMPTPEQLQLYKEWRHMVDSRPQS
jgi:hypothetical protein